MRLSHSSMYARVLASDASGNGHFFLGVVTTGIYCLPSCRARKPKPGNVRFFATCEAARAAGLRPCRKCHPDDFARGADPVLEGIEELVAEVRANPGAFANVRAVVQRSGFGASRLFELVRQHYHTTPADLLLRARLEAAKHQLLTEGGGLTEIAHVVGFESLSVFHEHFRRLNGLTPAAYRALRAGHEFRILLPDGYPLPYLRRSLGRDRSSISERLVGDRYTSVIPLSTGPALLTLDLSAEAVRAEIAPSRGPPATAPARRRFPPPAAVEAHAVVLGLLGLDQNAEAFVRCAKKLGLARLVAGRPALRLGRTPSVYDGLLWSILGQQINFPFACQLRRRLTEKVGRPMTDGLYAPPTPAAVAALAPADLLPLKFSPQKAGYLVAASRLVADGRLDLDALRAMSATRAESTLLALRGLGPWSVNYILMRSLGFADCVPLGDTGVASGLQALLSLPERPDAGTTRRLMARFSPHRSLATAHLWQFHQPPPA